MFCEECGTKNKKGATFCENCGHQMNNESGDNGSKKTIVFDKKKKVCAGIIAVVLVALISIYSYLSNASKPENVALKYFKACANNDVNTIYSVASVEESDFVNKKLLKESLKDSKKTSLVNYKIAEVKNANGISAVVRIAYIDSASNHEKIKVVNLVKSKKSGLFEKWLVDCSDLMVKDYRLTAPEGTKVLINNIEVDKKYKEKNSSLHDYYVIPSIIKGKYNVTLEYKNGIKLSGELKIEGSYSSIALSNMKLEKELDDNIKKDLKNKLKIMYDAAMSSKEFSEIKDTFNEDEVSSIEQSYNSLKSNITTDYNKLKEFSINDINIKVSSLEDDKIRLSVELNYDYKMEYKYMNETKEYSKKNAKTNLVSIYQIKDNKYSVINMGIITYFSHYNY